MTIPSDTPQESLRDFAIFQAGWLLRRAKAMADGPDEVLAIGDAFKAVAHLVSLRVQEEGA